MPIREKISKSDIINSKYYLPNKEISTENININTWFGITKNVYKNIEPVSKINIKSEEYIQTKQIKLNTTNDQKYLLLKWLEAARIIYNKTVTYIDKKEKEYNLKKEENKKNKIKKEYLHFTKIRPIIKQTFKKDFLNYIKKYNMPVHIMDNAIHDVIKAYKSSKALLDAGYITHFKIKHKKYTKNKQTMVIESGDFSKKNNGFYITSFNDKVLKPIILRNKFKKEQRKLKRQMKKLHRLKSIKLARTLIRINNKVNEQIINKKYNQINEMEASIDLKNIKCDVRLTYNKIKKTFILNIPKKYIRKENTRENTICSIDPGNSEFLNIYDPRGKCYKIYNRRETKENLTKLIKKRKEIKNFIDFKDVKLLNKRNEEYTKPISKIKKYYNRLTLKIQNKVKELHYKSAQFLCKMYSKIVLGKLSTKGITKGKRLTKLEKLFSYAISHDKFRTVLMNKAKEFGVKFEIVCEGNTTKTCGKCGKLNEKVGSSRVFKCSNCLLNIDRDLNAARNILIKHYPLI